MAFISIMALGFFMVLILAATALFFFLGLIFLVCGLTMRKKGLTVAGVVFSALFAVLLLFWLFVLFLS